MKLSEAPPPPPLVMHADSDGFLWLPFCVLINVISYNNFLPLSFSCRPSGSSSHCSTGCWWSAPSRRRWRRAASCCRRSLRTKCCRPPWWRWDPALWIRWDEPRRRNSRKTRRRRTSRLTRCVTLFVPERSRPARQREGGREGSAPGVRRNQNQPGGRGALQLHLRLGFFPYRSSLFNAFLFLSSRTISFSVTEIFSANTSNEFS